MASRHSARRWSRRGLCRCHCLAKRRRSTARTAPRRAWAAGRHLEDVSSEQIDDWSRHWPDASNTGVLTKHAPALDLDILNEEAARACEDLVRERFEEHGAVLVRIGRPPKRAILFRTEVPFSKILGPVTAPNGGADPRRSNF